MDQPPLGHAQLERHPLFPVGLYPGGHFSLRGSSHVASALVVSLHAQSSPSLEESQRLCGFGPPSGGIPLPDGADTLGDLGTAHEPLLGDASVVLDLYLQCNRAWADVNQDEPIVKPGKTK